MKVSELSGNALGLWVAKALGYELVSDPVRVGEAAAGMRDPIIYYSEAGVLGMAGQSMSGPWRPHEDWAQGGPIIEREKIEVVLDGNEWAVPEWEYDEVARYKATGPTPLIAAMRAYVISKFGDEVPQETQ